MSDLRITGLNAYVDRMLTRLAGGPGEAELREIGAGIAATSGRIEQSLRVKRVEPARLTPASRAMRGWLALMADAQQVVAYSTAVRTGQPLLDSAAVKTRWHRPIRLHLRPMRGLYKMRNEPGGAVLSIPTPSLCFETEDFIALAATVFGHDARGKKHLIDRMRSEEFQSLAAELEVLGGVVEETRGDHHDLTDSFIRMNAEHFAGAIARPRLYWSRALTRRKFGHYDWIGDGLMISRSLDAADVPRFVVDFVMYHELLHKHHGVRWTRGRRFAHTPEFRRDEKRFPQFDAAEAILGRLARRRR